MCIGTDLYSQKCDPTTGKCVFQSTSFYFLMKVIKMDKFICYVDKKGNSLPCVKEMSGIDVTNCKGCHCEQKHKEYLDEIDNNQKGD